MPMSERENLEAADGPFGDDGLQTTSIHPNNFTYRQQKGLL